MSSISLSKNDGSTVSEAPQPAALLRLKRVWLVFAAVAALLMSSWMMFGLGHLLGLYVPLETEYLYALMAVLLPLAFLLYPTKTSWAKPALLDSLLAALAFIIPATFVAKSDTILMQGWEYAAPDYINIMCFILWALVLEALRRAGGNAIFYVCLIFSLYPIVAEYAPGFLSGPAVPASITAGFYILGTESILGIPMGAFANLVIGFLIFGVALQYTGGGAFFLNLAFAILGKRRGGPAKVAIFASGLMGSMSGSVITNVLTTGVMTVPAMKRVGFRPAYAGGVEACASTGGVLMPPVMGATAFVMATFIEVSYASIVVAAAFPSLLYYLGLFLQIDAYAAREGIAGLPKEDIPSLLQVLKDGWYFIAVFALLVFMLLHMHREAQAPYYATALLLFINQLSSAHRWSWGDLLRFIEAVGRLFAELAALLLGVGLIIGALTLTGKVGSLAYELVRIAGGDVFLLLLVGALTSFVLGMGMTVTAAYLFLAVTLAPALTASGLDIVAVHLFMLYWGMVSFITPPVALGAFAAASIAKSNPMRTGLEAMRLGSVIYFIPFFFVLNPALIGRGDATEIASVFGSAVAGIFLISGGLQSYLPGFGRIDGNVYAAMAGRVLIALAGMLLAFPDSSLLGLPGLQWLAVTLLLALVGIALCWLARRSGARQPAEMTLLRDQNLSEKDGNHTA